MAGEVNICRVNWKAGDPRKDCCCSLSQRHLQTKFSSSPGSWCFSLRPSADWRSGPHCAGSSPYSVPIDVKVSCIIYFCLNVFHNWSIELWVWDRRIVPTNTCHFHLWECLPFYPWDSLMLCCRLNVYSPNLGIKSLIPSEMGLGARLLRGNQATRVEPHDGIHVLRRRGNLSVLSPPSPPHTGYGNIGWWMLKLLVTWSETSSFHTVRNSCLLLPGPQQICHRSRREVISEEPSFCTSQHTMLYSVREWMKEYVFRCGLFQLDKSQG